MNVENLPWTVKRFRSLKSKIDPQPQYQRGEVWTQPKQQLLIDSILNKYDIPKIYLHRITGGGMYDYHVCDGQQRLTAIWKFLGDDFPLGRSASGANWSGKYFSQLTKAEKDEVLAFKLITAVAYNATNSQIRELFARLQRGERLTPPELRNSMPSVLGDAIRAMARSHPFFVHTPFPSGRFKHDDLLAHAFAITIYGTEQDLKAPTLAAMYENFAGGVSPKHISGVNHVLTYLDKVQRKSGGRIATKWGFVDLFGLICNVGVGSLSPSQLAKRYGVFESSRMTSSRRPERLLAKSGRDRSLYDYIMAFRTSGGDAQNVAIRLKVLAKKLLHK